MLRYPYKYMDILFKIIILYTRSSGRYAPFLLAPAEGIGGPFGPSLEPFGPSRGPKGPPLPLTYELTKLFRGKNQPPTFTND